MRNEITATQAEAIQRMFGEISGRYDLANTLLSMGIHHAWRRRLVSWSGVRPGDRILDCATGTGDLAFAFERRLGTSSQVLGTDFCEPMLELARRKAAARGSRARFERADVMRLEYADESFDVVSIAFGIRNVADPRQGLRELGRVLRPGGTLMVLEFGQPRLPGLAGLYGLYSKHVLPRLGGLISGRREAYVYLESSSARFPCREDFVELARSTDAFEACEYRPLSLGIAWLYKMIRK